MTSKAPTRLVLTRIPDSWAWMRTDLLFRILPFALLSAVAYALASRPAWFGVGPGRIGDQVAFGLVAAPIMFVAAMFAQLWLARRRGALSAPAGRGDAWFQAGFFCSKGAAGSG